MSIKLFHRRAEGSISYTGINYCDEGYDGFNIVIKFWRVILYFRKRSKYRLAQMEEGTRQYIFGWDWKCDYSICGIKFNFDKRTLDVENVSIPIEWLDQYFTLNKDEEFIAWQQRKRLLRETLGVRQTASLL